MKHQLFSAFYIKLEVSSRINIYLSNDSKTINILYNENSTINQGNFNSEIASSFDLRWKFFIHVHIFEI